MPTSFGHAAAGIAAAWTADRRASNRLTVACALLAASPDLDLLFHTHRGPSHSLGAAIIVGVAAGLIVRSTRVARSPQAIRIGLICGLAYSTHILLDWLAIDTWPPYGLQALWPFSSEWYISGLNWFRQTERDHFFSVHAFVVNTKAVVQEMAILLPILGLLWLVRVKALARFAAEVPGRDHPPQ